MRAVFRHELSGYFTTPVGYVFLTMYALLSGLVFVFILSLIHISEPTRPY